MKIIFLLLTSLSASAGTVKVSSVYPDLSAPERNLKVSGSGLIFLSGSRQFVLTASHVSQGQGTEISLDGKALKIKSRVRHGNNDLELLEVEGAAPERIKASYDGAFISYDTDSAVRRRWLDKYNFVILQDWISDPHLDTDSAFARTRPAVFAMDLFSALLNADALIQPGTSGAPLITQVPQKSGAGDLPYDVREGFRSAEPGKYLVRGLAIRRDRFFAHSSFVPYARMHELLQNYLDGKPAPETTTRWSAQGAMLFRQTDGYQETAAYSSATAGGLISDSGNAITMEGGDLATLGEDTPAEFLNRVSAFPVAGREPVMYWMMAMRHPRTSVLINFWSWFDMELYPLFSRGGGLFTSFVKESPDLTLVSQLSPRFNTRGDFQRDKPAQIKKDSASVQIGLPLKDGDRLEFRLEKNGAYGGAARYQPVIEVPSKNGQIYLVDLRELFFVDTASSKTAPLRQSTAAALSRDKVLETIYDEMESEILRPRISYRKKRTDLSRPMTTEEGLKTTVEWN